MITRYLMDSCFIYQEGSCPVDEIRLSRRAQEIKPGEEIPTFPVGAEQQKLDQICEKCDRGIFEIQEDRRCPVCLSDLTSLDWVGETGVGPKPAAPPDTYTYRCGKCRRVLYSHTRISQD